MTHRNTILLNLRNNLFTCYIELKIYNRTLFWRLLKSYKMSNKITDARIEELQRLKSLKEKLRAAIQKEQGDMQDILNSMNDEAQEFVSSSSKAAKAARGKGSSSLDHQDEIDAHEVAIARLEEEFSGVERKLEDLEDVINST